MKRIKGWLFLFLFVFSNTELHQLSKIPSLITHYIEHQSEFGTETFINFLVEHYSLDNTHCKQNSEDHRDLPFKADDCSSLHQLPFTPYEHRVSLMPFIRITEKISIPKDIACKSFGSIGNIWQPPRQV